MRFHSFLIKYGEIGIKGKNRYLFEDALVRQIRFALKDVDGEFNVHKAQGRVYVFETSVWYRRNLPGCASAGQWI